MLPWGGALHVSWVEVLTWHCHALPMTSYDIIQSTRWVTCLGTCLPSGQILARMWDWVRPLVLRVYLFGAVDICTIQSEERKTVCWNATFMVMIWHGHPVWIRWANFSYPRRSGPDVCTAFVGEVLADEIPPDRSTKSGKWFASRFDGRDLHCPSCSEFQAIHCWT